MLNLIKKIAVLLVIILIYCLCAWKSFRMPEPVDVSTFKIANIASISCSDTITTDLLFLQKYLKDKNIVLLGEDIHDNERVFSAKIRIIKYLHEKMGYSVLLFESPRFESELYQNQLDSNYFQKTLWEFWANSPSCKTLLDYIQQSQKSSKPIKTRGFDLQFLGNNNIKQYIELPDTYLQKKGSSLSHYPVTKKMIQNINSYRYWVFLQDDDFDSIQNEISSLVEMCHKPPFNNQDTVFANYFANFMNYARFNKMQWGSNERFQFRDSVMASYFSDMYTSIYAGEKVVVWLANLHALHDDTQYVENAKMNHFKTFGERLKEGYKDKVYTICFTSYCNVNKNNRVINKATPATFEYQMHQLNYRYAFVDFHNDTVNSDIPFRMRANQNLILNANWKKMCDGIFYIDTVMQNSHEYN